MTRPARYKEQALEDFSVPQRIYSDHELKDFHNKIQKFWVGEPRELNSVAFGVKIEGLAQKFDHEELAVAFGAAIKVKHGKGYVYLHNERSKVLQNLWKQYEGWRQKQDWIGEKNVERLEVMAEEIPF